MYSIVKLYYSQNIFTIGNAFLVWLHWGSNKIVYKECTLRPLSTISEYLDIILCIVTISVPSVSNNNWWFCNLLSLDATIFAKQIFQMMDQDLDGNVSFEEFLVVMSILSRGSLDEKLQWVFNLYDLNGDGFLTVETMSEIGLSIYDMLGKYTEPPIQESTVKEHVSRVFVVSINLSTNFSHWI